MSTKTYTLVWAAFSVVAAILWLGGVFSMFIGVVFGFVAFGLVFMGMICVLPPAVSHPAQTKAPEIMTAEKSQRASAAMPTFRSA